MFHGTTASLMETTEDVCILRERTLASLLERYLSTLEQPHGSPDQAILEEALHTFQQCRQIHALDEELAHLGVILYYHLQDYQALFVLLEEYRQQPLSVYEEAWARWYGVDCLALQRKHEASVDAQQGLLSWAQQYFSPEQCLFTWNDSTQALSWLACNEEDRWLSHAQEVLQVQPTSASREDRFFLLRTIIMVLIRLHKGPDAYTYLLQLRAIEQERMDEIKKSELHLETTALHIQVLAALEGQFYLSDIHQLAKNAISQLHHLSTKSPSSTIQNHRTIRRLAHNIGSQLYRGKQYSIAIPFFEIAIEYGSTSPYTYLWLAASLYALPSPQDDRITNLVQQAKERGSNSLQSAIQHIPEFDAAIREQMSAFP